MSLSVVSPYGVQDALYGQFVSDPFRWLEERSSPITGAWIAQQILRSDNYFNSLINMSTLRDMVANRLDVDNFDQPTRAGGKLFYRFRKRGEEQGSIYMREVGPSKQRLLVDPKPEGIYTSVGLYRVSDDGKLLAFERKQGGSDRKEVYILDVRTCRICATLTPAGYAYGLVFAPSLNGFFYCHETDDSTNQHSVYFKRFGRHFENTDSDCVFRVRRSQGSKIILSGDGETLQVNHIYQQDGKRLLDFWVRSTSEGCAWRRTFARTISGFIPYMTHNRIIAIVPSGEDSRQVVEYTADGNELRVIVPAQRGGIRRIAVTRGSLFLETVSLGRSCVHRWSFEGSSCENVFPSSQGTTRLLPQLCDSNSIFLLHESHSAPPSIYEYQSNTHICVLLARRAGSSECHESSQRYAARDGTMIPVTLLTSPTTSRHAPVVLVAYGCFGAANVPSYSVFFSILLECGVVIAIPEIRGGGGPKSGWHEAGRRRNKQTTISDLIDAAKWLHIQPSVDAARLALLGASAGGLVTAAAAMQSPLLFRALVCIGPLLDMIRYDKLGSARRWTEEFGTSDDRDDFVVLSSYSPYHNIPKASRLPAILFVTGDRDDRCDPCHVRKMAARLQDSFPGQGPVIVDYGAERGHSPSLPLQARVSGLTRRLAFLCDQLALSNAVRRQP